MKTTKIFAIIAIAAISVSTLGGCATFPNLGTDRSDSTPEPSAEPVIEALVGDTDGDGKLSGFERDQLAKQSYILPDGTAIPLVKGERPPAEVISAVQASVLAQAGPATDGPIEERGARSRAARIAIEAESAKLGTVIIPVFYVFDGMVGDFVWSVGGQAAGSVPVSGDEASAVAAAQAWVGAQTDKYTIIVFA